ncbi:HD-GYP domain-containing protein [Agrobacterium burrii]|uniref:HD-GYP domain-containing protein n=1 Tax=Agrobacterium burrii TaxID=2815339 RepID=A0ABS3EQC2_9HYPH|nr:HD-GYP domain-containing protein [Agrobacterium burrii]MBO0134191.1 HD-GYP domain-containing protein [Agrobacterium burrii]
MLKHIKPEQVRLGMFIESVDGDWKGQRFWKSRFLLVCPKDAESLRSSSADDIVINTDEGADVALAPPRRNSGTRRAVRATQLARALQTIEHAKPLIETMFEDARMGKSIPVGNAMRVVDEIAACMNDSARALVAVSRLKTRDEHTFLHSVAVTALMVHLGRSIKADENTIQVLGLGGLLHDVGKVKTPLDILNKISRLTDPEMALVRQHPLQGYELLSRQGDMPDAVLDICMHHHERLDGKGYPKGLSGCEITLPVRIASICDVYDALTSKRPYKQAWVPGDAAEFMFKQEGQFDQTLLRCFFRSLSAIGMR